MQVIQNPDFDAVASLPFTRELRLSSSAWGEFGPRDVVGGFAGQLRRVVRLLRSVAHEFDVSWQLTQRQLRFAQALDQVSRQTGLVVADRPPQVPVDSRRRYRQVVVVFDGSNERVLQVGAALAREHNALLQVLVTADGSHGFSARRAAADKLLHGAAVQWRFQALPADDELSREQVATRLAIETQHVQSLVVLPSHSLVCPPARGLARLTAATIVLVP